MIEGSRLQSRLWDIQERARASGFGCLVIVALWALLAVTPANLLATKTPVMEWGTFTMVWLWVSPLVSQWLRVSGPRLWSFATGELLRDVKCSTWPN